MARSSRIGRQQARAAREKKLLLGLVPVLAVLLAVQVPKLLHHGGAAAAPTPPVAVPAPAAGTGVSLADTDVAPVPGEGQVARLDLFEPKDPFVPQVEDTAPATATAPPSTGPRLAPKPPAPKQAPPVPKPPVQKQKSVAPPAPAPSGIAVARLSVDGSVEPVRRRHGFPAAAPLFRLVSFDGTVARVGVVDGSYENGAATLPLRKGEPVTLENTADGTRYVLLYRGTKTLPPGAAG